MLVFLFSRMRNWPTSETYVTVQIMSRGHTAPTREQELSTYTEEKSGHDSDRQEHRERGSGERTHFCVQLPLQVK